MKIKVNAKFTGALKTGIRNSPIIYIPHFHYSYVDQALLDIADTGNYFKEDQIFEMSNFDGRIDFKSKLKSGTGPSSLDKMLQAMIREKKDFQFFGFDSDENVTEKIDILYERIFLVKNAAEQLSDPNVQYWLQVFASKYERGDIVPEMTLIIVSPQPVSTLPQEIEKFLYVIDIPAPSEDEIVELIKDTLPVGGRYTPVKERYQQELARAMMGLQLYEVEQIIRTVNDKCGLTRESAKVALEEKKSIIKKSGIIEVVDSDVSFDQVGGLEELRKDLEQKATVFKHLNDIQQLKFPLPKGVLILGMPGCGKSLIAKSIANKFGVSLLRLDVNRLMGQYVGQSEENLRKALMTAEAAHPCVLWIDEIEKAFAGVNSSNSSNDIIMRLMGHFLTWMQERKTAVYIVATANDALRPELMRKGRFDEVYFVDFPNEKERVDILKKKINNFRKTSEQQKLFDFSDVDVEENIAEIAKAMIGGKIEVKDENGKKQKIKNDKGFSGAEIEAIVNAVMEKKYVEYLVKKDKEDKINSNQDDSVKEPIKITKDDFDEEIKAMQPSVMCNQKGGKDENGRDIKTPVERIRDLQDTYKFKPATFKPATAVQS